jgi:putative SOS response-associated peptidase YedK
MCGRYTLHLKRLAALRRVLGVERSAYEDNGHEVWSPRYNAAPGQDLPVIRVAQGDRVLSAVSWGLLPAWSRAGPPEGSSKARRAPRPINARVETIETLPSFRDPFARRRCVVPVTGYFEWRATPAGAAKEPLWIHPRHTDLDDEPPVMALAGIWDRFTSEDGEVLDSFAIVTTAASERLSVIHDRMPLELHGDDVERWLARDPITGAELSGLVQRSSSSDRLLVREVSPIVGSVIHDAPDCIAEVERTYAQLDLFGG